MKNKRVIISWTLLIGWMLFIFCMSNQPAEVSTKQSDLVIKLFSAIGIDLLNHSIKTSYIWTLATNARRNQFF